MGTQNYLFEEFQATGKWSNDLRVDVPGLDDGCDYAMQGFHYLGGSCWIEECTLVSKNFRWTTVIGNKQPSSNSLDAVERELYSWCISQRFELPDPPKVTDNSEQITRLLWSVTEKLKAGLSASMFIEPSEKAIAERMRGTVQWYCYEKLGQLPPPTVSLIRLDNVCGLACKTVIDGARSINANAGNVTEQAIKTVCILIDS